MAIIYTGNIQINKTISTPAFVITEVEIIGSDMYATGRGCLADMKVTLTVSSIGNGKVEVGYMVINCNNRLLSYKGKFQMPKCESISEQIVRALACL